MSLFASILKDIDNCIAALESGLQKQSNDSSIPMMNDHVSGSSKQSQFRYLVVLDFEATCDEDRSFKPNEIIEWPAIIIDLQTLTIYNDPSDYFHFYVRPTVNKQLTNFCTELTGITQTMVNHGISIEEARIRWNEWCFNHNLLPDDDCSPPKSCVVTCGDWDLNVMWTKQCKVSSFGVDKPAVLFHGWINIKMVFERMFGTKKPLEKGMMGMLEYLQIKHEGRHHSGIDDVRNICKIVVEMYKRDNSLFDDYTKTFVTKKKGKVRSLSDDVRVAKSLRKMKQTR